METNNELRLIIEEHEDVIKYDKNIPHDTLHEVVVYIIDQLRKKYSSDTFTFRDSENTHYQLEDIVEYEVSPIFISIPHRHNQTFVKPDPRPNKNVYTFNDPNSVHIEKFENLKKCENVQIKTDVIRSTNKFNKNLQFEDPILSADFGKMKIEITSVKEHVEISSPTFGKSHPDGNKTNEASNFMLKPEQLVTDMSKRQKVPLPDGKSQNDFIKMSAMNKNPLGKKVELQMYTLEDVKKHNRSNDAWMVINGKVYDVTKYIPFHPGGNKILMGVGKDGTSLYNQYHPWVNANFLLEKYHIGFLKK